MQQPAEPGIAGICQLGQRGAEHDARRLVEERLLVTTVRDQRHGHAVGVHGVLDLGPG